MGRKKQNHVYRYFELDKTKTKSKCLVCNKALNSINSSNLIKHLKIHKKEYKEIHDLNIKQRDTKKITPNSEIITRECTKLVCVHGRPLALLDDEAFQNILSLIPDCNVKVNSRSIRNDIIETAAKLRYDLAQELQNKMICIKIDIASLSLRSFMGINAQYLEKGVIVLKNLAMIELLERHTSEHLKDQVLYVLSRFRIGLENIYSFTTDNGSNMLKMSRIINEENRNLSAGDVYEENARVNTETEDVVVLAEDQSSDSMLIYTDDIDNLSANSDSDIEYDADTEFDTEREEQFSETVTSALSMHCHENTIQQRSIAVVRCAAHTLQLSVLDAIDGADFKKVIDDARQIAKKLRTQIYCNIISKSGKNQAIIDSPTRWNSTVDMIQRLIDLKEICDNSVDSTLHLAESFWNTLKNYMDSLLPAKELSKILQQEQLTISDFYLQWLLCKIKLKTMGTTLSVLLECCMENREQMLFKSDAFICAIFMDGRVNSTLSEHQQLNAKRKLLELHLHLQNLNTDKENVPSCSFTSNISDSQTRTDSARAELEDFLSTKYVEAQSDFQNLIRPRTNNMEMHLRGFRNLDDEIAGFLKEPLLKSTENILNHWELKKNTYPRLYKLACIVLACPATQVSVERLFSSLKFVVSRYRLNLKSNIIEDIIFIRNNKIFNKNN